MAIHAGFAAAITVRENVLTTALDAAYANGTFPHVLEKELPFGGPDIESHLFLGPPTVNCEGPTGLLVLSLGVWGQLDVTTGGALEVVDLIADIEITLDATFAPGKSVQLEAEGDAIVVRRWDAVVTSPTTSAATSAYLVGDEFRERIESILRGGVLIGEIGLPSIDVSFLGPIGPHSRTVKGKIRNGLLLLGFNIDNDDTTIIGDPEALADFAGGNDIAGVINAAASKEFLDELNKKMKEEVEDAGATLDRLDVVPRNGFFFVDGAASNDDGTVNFTFHLVPQMMHTRPGAQFPAHPKSYHVKPQTWPALEFRIEAVTTDVDRSFWTIVKEVVFGILTAGLGLLYAEQVIAATAGGFSSQLKNAKPGSASARVRRTVAPRGGVAVRIALDQFDISPIGTLAGVSVRSSTTPAAVLGPALLPETYTHERVRYHLRLPSGAFERDPALRVAWVVQDQTHGLVVVNIDRPATGGLEVDFVPSASPGARDFSITARAYRQLGAQVTEVAGESVNLRLRGQLSPQTYVRWRSQVNNPQIQLGPDGETWGYLGNKQVLRWSEWHRTDSPCRAVNASNRYRHDFEIADVFPFPIRLLESHRKGLCPYCFFGGPAGLQAEL